MTEYPLEQLVEIKQKRVDDAEKLLVEKKELLATEEKKLKACIDKAEATQSTTTKNSMTFTLLLKVKGQQVVKLTKSKTT